jgi:hypothetical protein
MSVFKFEFRLATLAAERRTTVKTATALMRLLSREGRRVRKLIAFDDETFDKLKQLGRDRMATIQELADEAFADVLRKHGIPLDLKDALRKSARSASPAEAPAKKNATSNHQGKRKP